MRPPSEAPGSATAAERAVLERIGPDPLLELLETWIPLRSDAGRETPMQRSVARELERRGLAVEVSEIDLETLRRHPAWSAEIARREGIGVLGTLRGKGGGRSLILNGHVDVVPPGDESQWTRSPWRATVEGGRVYGRGACDMKGGLACAAVAAAAIRDAGVALAGDLRVQSVIGEEDGGCGSLAAAVAGQRADGAVIAEPTGLTVAPAQAGALNFRLHLRGRAAHAAVRHEGVSALEKLPPLLAALEAHERRLNEGGGGRLFESWPVPFPLCVGTVRGGDWASTVPDSLVCEGRLGVPVGSDAAEARLGLERAIAEAATADPWLVANPPRVEWWGGQYEPASIPADHPLVETLIGALPSAGGPEARVVGVPYGSDLRLLVREAATPTVLFGPGDLRQAHAADEFVPLDDLVICARALALTALRFCGVA